MRPAHDGISCPQSAIQAADEQDEPLRLGSVTKTERELPNQEPSVGDAASAHTADQQAPKSPTQAQARTPRSRFAGTEFEGPTRKKFPLRGRIHLNLPAGRGPMFVQASSVGTEPGESDVALGSSSLTASGEFQVDAWALGKPETVRLSFSDERGLFHVEELPLEDLSMPLGVDLEAEVYEFTMEVRDVYNRPIHGAKLRVSSPNIGASDAWNSASTGPDGRASFLLPAGPVEYCLAKPGLQFSQGTLDWNPEEDDSPVVLTLQRLRIQDTTEGRVVDGRGLPVENALVVAGPHTRVSELASSAKVSARTNRDGNFRLQVAGNSAIELSAYLRELGQTQTLTLRGGEQGLSLQFPEDDGPKSTTTIPRAKGS